MSDPSRPTDQDPSPDPDLAAALQGSDQDVEGSMGVSSERRGHAGPGQHAATGVRDNSERERPVEDAPPEQSAGGEEVQPEGLPPKAGYSSVDPRSEDPDSPGDLPEDGQETLRQPS